ncbi:DUF1801 domain-containing protein [Rhodobacter sp. KR11]|uniref:iron chaperone n=1 Tax=Rhodobacter sp. KR11 TaxID=2974588 RepID=UPI0022237BE6|nr:DUF1801 domain-containing protein [Rhodobacter sp. KR11]MCW1917838.1 DUF1801 domain-containing protein [Rhodobacter sp. KR11]
MSAEVDAYISALPPDQAQALTWLRAVIKSRLPDHLEVISYKMPGFRQPGSKGRMVAGYAAFARNCGYYPHSGNIIGQLGDLTQGFKTTPGAISFTPAHPLPEPLIQALIQARLAEITQTGK